MMGEPEYARFAWGSRNVVHVVVWPQSPHELPSPAAEFKVHNRLDAVEPIFTVAEDVAVGRRRSRQGAQTNQQANHFAMSVRASLFFGPRPPDWR